MLEAGLNLDFLVLAILLIGSVVVGLRTGRGMSSADAYLLGDRSLPWWAILGSIVATETSTATVLSVPGEAAAGVGFRWLQLPLGYLLGRLIVARLLLPRYFDGQLMTAYELLEKRFGIFTRRACSLVFLIARNLGDGLRLFLAGLVLQTMLDWPFEVGVGVMGVVTVIYTVLGGLKSVVWNDCIQFVIYMAGGVAAVFVLLNRIPGGWDGFTAFAAKSGQLQMLDLSWSLEQPFNLWAGLIGGAVLTLGTHGTDHMMVQRYLSARSLSDARKAVIWSGVVVLLQFALFLLIGVLLANFLDATARPLPKSSDQIFVQFIVKDFPRGFGLIGLMLAAVLSAAMSTLSSSLNASASAVLNDFWLPLRRTAPPDATTQLRWSRWLTVVFGIVQIGTALWAQTLEKSVVQNALSIAGFSAGLLLGIFLLGVFAKRAGQTAAMVGAACGLSLLLAVKFVLPAGIQTAGFTLQLNLAWPWLALTGALTTCVCGSLAARIWPGTIKL
jgi:SSS family solute:Na+ symporter